MRALPQRAALCGSALFTFLFASAAASAQTVRVPAQTAKPVITLAPSPLPDPAVYPVKPGDATFKNAPANYHVFAPVHVGDDAAAEMLTLQFSAATQLTKIESTKDFVIDAGSSCQEGNRYGEGDSCILLVRFTPQGAGHRLGRISLWHTASPEPMSLGLLGNGYAPVVSFTPALITTVPGTYPSGKGLLSGATNLTVDGGDTVYIADTGNSLIREIDSSGTITSVGESDDAPASLAVDSFGYIWVLPTPSSFDFLYFYDPSLGTIGWNGSYSPGSCTPSSPCLVPSVGLGNPGSLSIDSNDNLFLEEESYGAAEIPVAGIANGGTSFEDPSIWYLRDSYAPFSANTTALATDYNGDLYTYYHSGSTICDIVEESAYAAENPSPLVVRVAGGANCGFSGDGGQARNAEIGSSVGQMFFDIAGNLYFSDTANQRVRRIDASTGIVNTIAGNGTAGYDDDGFPATIAELSSPTGVAVDSQGQVYIISSAATGQVVRKLGPAGALDFHSIIKGTSSAAVPVTVSNTGDESLVLTRAYITGTNAGDYAIDPNTTTCILTAGATLANGQSCKVGVIFTPSATGGRSGSLVFLDNTVTGTNTVQLAGTGILATPSFSITAPTSGAMETSGTAFTFSVSVTSTSGPQPTGTVTMLLNGTAIQGSPAALNGSGVASLSVESGTTGTNTLSATYSGDSHYVADGPITRSITVNAPAVVKSATTVALASSANPADGCNAVQFSITVTGSEGATPTGIVKLWSGSTMLGEADLSGGSATLSNIQLAAGTTDLTVHYSGDTTHEAATSAVLKQVVSDTASCSSGIEHGRPIESGRLIAK